jgi:hypothetical protein
VASAATAAAAAEGAVGVSGEEPNAALESSLVVEEVESMEVGLQAVEGKKKASSPPLSVTAAQPVRSEVQAKSQPKVLVEDTQSDVAPSPVKPVVAAPAEEKQPEQQEDVEMADAEPRNVKATAKGKKKSAAVEVDTDDLYSVAGADDDSGARFAVPMDEGVEGDEEEMAAAGADMAISAADEGAFLSPSSPPSC